MGGNAFPNLRVPRLTPKQYETVREECVQKLRTRYTYVETPPEAPGKESHGDVDILLSEGLQTLPMTHKREIGELLGAKPEHMILHGISNNYALPHPDEPGAYCQVDVHLVAAGHEEWQMLMHSYGDLMQIVGKFLRYCGLTATDRGLFVRIREIEEDNKKQAARLFLTSDVKRCCEFVGLDYQKWKNGFDTEQDILDWCCTGKYFSARAYDFEAENHNDRQRMSKRNQFNDAKDWVLANEALFAGTCREKEELRDCALKDALATFGKEADYRAKLEVHEATQAEKACWHRIKDMIPREGHNLGIALRALRRWVYFDETHQPSVRSAAEMDQERQPKWTEHIAAADDEGAAIYEWVAKRWEEVYRNEKDRESEGRRKREAAM